MVGVPDDGETDIGCRMTHQESQHRERKSWWLGFLAGSALWAMVAFVIVWVFEGVGNG